MSQSLKTIQLKTLKILSGVLGSFYLTGGTALALFYFQHRVSEDLDFFTQEFNAGEIAKIITEFKAKAKKPISLISENLGDKFVKMQIYSFEYQKTKSLKIDFVEDTLPILQPFKVVDGVSILSLEDIYLRKIQAVGGSQLARDEVGATKLLGARQTAKDLVDLYFLSHTFIGLADYAQAYCDQAKKEGLIRWFRTFDRMKLKLEITELNLQKDIEFVEIDRHFSRQIKKLVEMEIG